jgi:hypothetical protein
MQDIFEIVKPWMQMTEQEIKDKFLTLPNAQRMGVPNHAEYENIYVPGTRKDRVLLVSHLDTVWLDRDIQPILHDEIVYSGRMNRKDKSNSVGIGADDRAGIAMIWELRNLGHSILITGCEEEGCRGALAIARMAPDEQLLELNNHNFAIEFDRRGYRDIVFYNIGTPAFLKYVKKETGYKEAEGSYTDICVICQTMTGVNISVGYLDEHTIYETLNLKAWKNTLKVVNKWISKEDLPKFEQ